MTFSIKLKGKNQKLGFSSAHIIPLHEKCGRLHGHNYFVDFKAEGNLNEENQVVDFGIIKKDIRKICQNFDHKFLLATYSHSASISKEKSSIRIKIGDK